MTGFEITLLTTIGTAIAGAAKFIYWLVKTLVPKIFESWDNKNNAIIEATQKTSEAVSKIPATIQNFEKSLLGTEQRICNKISEETQNLKDKIFDRRIDDLRDRMGSYPDSKSFSRTNE